jgi:hypothetical protein
MTMSQWAEKLAVERYEQFDAPRREQARIEADMAEIERIGKELGER